MKKNDTTLSMDCALRYHPLAYDEAVVDLLNQLPPNLVNENAAFFDLLKHVRSSAGGISPVEAREHEWRLKFATSRIDFHDTQGHVILDAHQLPIGEDGATPIDRFAGEWSTMGPVYIYFGENAFPSPYPGSGINGAYVETRPMTIDNHPGIKFRFTLSPEIVPWYGAGTINEGNIGKEVLLNSRLYTFMVAAREANGAVDWDDPYGLPCGDEEVIDEMTPSIRAPMLHAWRALCKWRSKEVASTIAADEDMRGGDRRRLGRASTIEELRAINLQLVNRQSDPAVVILHSHDQEPEVLPCHYVDGEADLAENLNLSFPETLAWADYFACRASASTALARGFFGERIVDLITRSQPETHQDDIAYTGNLALGHCYRIFGMMNDDRWSELRDMIAEGEFHPGIRVGFYQVFRLATVALLEEWEALQASLPYMTSDKASTAWGRVLAEACLGQDMQASLVAAMKANPLVPAFIEEGLQRYRHLDPFNMPIEEPIDEAIHIGLMLRPAWEEHGVTAKLPIYVLEASREALGARKGEASPSVLMLS